MDDKQLLIKLDLLNIVQCMIGNKIISIADNTSIEMIKKDTSIKHGFNFYPVSYLIDN